MVSIMFRNNEKLDKYLLLDYRKQTSLVQENIFLFLLLFWIYHILVAIIVLWKSLKVLCHSVFSKHNFFYQIFIKTCFKVNNRTNFGLPIQLFLYHFVHLSFNKSFKRLFQKLFCWEFKINYWMTMPVGIKLCITMKSLNYWPILYVHMANGGKYWQW